MNLHPLRETVRVVMHLPGGYTKVTLEKFEGKGLADGSIGWDIPTEAIPPHLRAIGSRFFATMNCVHPEKIDDAEDLRLAVRNVKIEEL